MAEKISRYNIGVVKDGVGGKLVIHSKAGYDNPDVEVYLLNDELRLLYEKLRELYEKNSR